MLFRSEIYGHAGLEADLEIQELALDGLQGAGVRGLTIDLGDARIVRSLLAGLAVDAARQTDIVAALTAKDAAELRDLTAGAPEAARRGLLALLDLYGGDAVLAEAARLLPSHGPVTAALADDRLVACFDLTKALANTSRTFDVLDATLAQPLA